MDPTRFGYGSAFRSLAPRRPTTALGSLDDIATGTRRKWGAHSVRAEMVNGTFALPRWSTEQCSLVCASPEQAVAPNPHSTPIVSVLTGILLTVQGHPRFLTCKGGLEFNDDRDGFGTDGFGKRGDLPGPCVRRLPHEGLKAVARATLHHLFMTARSDNFNRSDRASQTRAAGVPCATMTSYPTASWH